MPEKHITIKGNYPGVHVKDHPRADVRGKVYEHIVIAEKALGHYLSAKHPVHHVDCVRGVNTNNCNSNLVICQDKRYHRLLHRRTRALTECGHADWIKCGACKRYDAPTNLQVYERPGVFIANHRECRSLYDKNRYRVRCASPTILKDGVM